MACQATKSLRRKEYEDTIDAMNELHEGCGSPDPGKDELRINTNKLCKALLQKLIEKGTFTVEKVMDDIDLVNRCTMHIGNYTPGVTTKYAVQLGLYAKSIKNLGTKIHDDALRKACTMEEMG